MLYWSVATISKQSLGDQGISRTSGAQNSFTHNCICTNLQLLKNPKKNKTKNCVNGNKKSHEMRHINQHAFQILPCHNLYHTKLKKADLAITPSQLYWLHIHKIFSAELTNMSEFQLYVCWMWAYPEFAQINKNIGLLGQIWKISHFYAVTVICKVPLRDCFTYNCGHSLMATNNLCGKGGFMSKMKLWHEKTLTLW